MDSPTIRPLVDEALAGTPAAVAELTARTEKLLDELSARYADEIWGESSVSDLRQIVLQKYVQFLRQFRGTTPDHYRNWLAQIVEKSRLNMIRGAVASRPANGTVFSLDLLTDGSESQPGVPAPRAPDLSVSQQVQLKLAVEALDPRDRKLFELRYRDGLEIEAIAACVGLHERTVRRRLEEVRTLLRNQLESPR